MSTDSPEKDVGLHRSVAVVLPCYNAGPRLRPVAEKLCSIVECVLVVDDGSTDGTAEHLDGLPVAIVRLDPNRGKGVALLAGFRAALDLPHMRYVATCDADGQHDPDELPALFHAAEEAQSDLLIGSRTFGLQHVPWPSRLGNKLTILLTTWLLGQRLPDTQSGYRLHSRRFVEDIVAHVSGGRYETEMDIVIRAVRGRYRVATAPIRTIYETGNQSSHFNKLRDSFRIYRTLLGTVWQRKAP